MYIQAPTSVCSLNRAALVLSDRDQIHLNLNDDLILLPVSTDKRTDFALEVAFENSYLVSIFLRHDCFQVLFSQIVIDLGRILGVDCGELSC